MPSSGRSVSVWVILSMILGVSGTFIGVYSISGLNTAMSGIQDIKGVEVGILDPDQDDTVSGIVEIRAMIWSSSAYTVQVLINGSLNATAVPFKWNTTKLDDGPWKITVIVTNAELNVSQDEIVVNVLNNPTPETVPKASAYLTSTQLVTVTSFVKVELNAESYDPENRFDLTTHEYITPESGYYLVIGSVGYFDFPDQEKFYVSISVNGLSKITSITHSANPPDDLIIGIVTGVLYLSSGDTVGLYTLVNTATRKIQGGMSSTFLTIYKLV